MALAYNGLLVLVALGFAAMGWIAIAAPQCVLAQFGVPNLNVDGRNEVRAVYGGFGLAIAALLGFALIMPALREGICLAVAVALGGMAAGRLLSAAIDSTLGRTPLIYMVIELLGAALLVLARLG